MSEKFDQLADYRLKVGLDKAHVDKIIASKADRKLVPIQSDFD